MRGRGFGRAIAAALLLAPAAAAPGHRVVAVGDLHGDLDAWRAIGRAAGVLDDAGHWTGGTTILIQDGDAVDRGPDSLGVIRDLIRLQGEAAEAGGHVIAIVGDHEAMNVTGDLRYNVPADYAAFATADSAAVRDRAYAARRPAIEAAYRRDHPRADAATIRAAWLAATPLGFVEHRQAWSPRGWIGGWIARNPAVVEIDGTLFVHGGIGAAFACLPVATINRRVDAALARADADPRAIINDPYGPLWYRGLATRDPRIWSPPPADDPPCGSGRVPPTIDAELAAVLPRYGAARMVVAHTPALAPIQILHDGRLVRIDTGISRVYGGPLTWLEIENGTVTAHVVARPGGGQGS